MRHIGNIIIAVFITIFLFVAGISFWYHGDILNGTQFTRSFTEGLLSEDSKEAIASKIIDSSLSNRPVIKASVGTTGKSAVYTLLSSNAFQSEFDTLVGNIHKRMVTPSDPSIGINIIPLKEYVLPLIRLVRPDLINNLNISELPDRVVLIPDKYIPKLYQFTPIIFWTGIISGLLALIATGFFFHRIQKGWYALLVLGLTLTIASLSVIAFTLVAPDALVRTIKDENVQIILQSVITVFIKSYRLQLYVFLASGIALSLAGYISLVIQAPKPGKSTRKHKKQSKK